MTVDVDIQVRPAVLADQSQIANLMHFSLHVHRHLDWRYALDWIDSPPFLVLETKGQMSAALACPPDPPRVAWIRLFVNSGKISLEKAWQALWENACSDLSRQGRFLAAAIALEEWYIPLLLASGFENRQSIVMLERDGGFPADALPWVGFSIHAMRQSDLPAVAAVDAAAFDLLWQNSLPALKQAFPQAVLASVAESQGRVIGYQISTRNPLGAHLARLAVLPEVQGRGIGYALVADLAEQAGRLGMTHLTVNTQSDNATSLALYQRAGFHETGERYPVFQLQIP